MGGTHKSDAIGPAAGTGLSASRHPSTVPPRRVGAGDVHTLRRIWRRRGAVAGALVGLGTVMILLTIGLVIVATSVVVSVLSLFGLGP